MSSSSIRLSLLRDTNISNSQSSQWDTILNTRYGLSQQEVMDGSFLQSQVIEEASQPVSQQQSAATIIDDAPLSLLSTVVSTDQVIRRIEDQVAEIIQALDRAESPSLSHHKRFTNMAQCRNVTSMLMVLAFCHSLLLAKRTTTTREVYYFYVTHFRSQKECDSVILDCANLLNVPRSSLGLVASPKGWFCGCIEIVRNGTVVDGRALVQGVPITREWLLDPTQRDFVIRSCTAKCILVVEKEGVYNRLSEDGFYDKYPCILVTGKGFPDLATRAMVHTLHTEWNELPVYGLCDCNPYGVSVLQTYKYGSERMGCDGGDRYSVPIKWLGLRPSQVEALQPQLATNVFQQLTDVDKKRLEKLCQPYHPFHDNHDHQQERLDELCLMQTNGYKVELEALHWLGMDFLSKWVEDLLVRHENSNGDDDDTDASGSSLVII